MATVSRRSGSPMLPVTSTFRRSPISPAGKLCSGVSPASYFYALSPPPTGLYYRPTSPTRVNLAGAGYATPAVRISMDRATSPGRHLAVEKKQIRSPAAAAPRRLCMCSPTTHPGSFRCSLHKGAGAGARVCGVFSSSSPSHRLHARRSAMTNSLVRIGTVEGEWVRRALTALIRPSSHQQRRRAAFRPRPSRLSVMSMAVDER